MNKQFYTVFKKGSKTFFSSSLFFPINVRRDVAVLYSFVRTGDNYVDNIPQDAEGFYRFKKSFYASLNGKSSKNLIIDSFVFLIKKKNFKRHWIDAYFYSMEMDIKKRLYYRLSETEKYMYGSAEVIGLMMARIMDLSDESLKYAQLLGKSMQYINFIRDIDEDNRLGRIYLPVYELNHYGLKDLKYKTVIHNQDGFRAFIQKQLERYQNWQEKAEKGFKYIPKRYLIPIKTASEMYKWTALKIMKNPFILYKKNVKPSRLRIILQIFKSLLAGEA